MANKVSVRGNVKNVKDLVKLKWTARRKEKDASKIISGKLKSLYRLMQWSVRSGEYSRCGSNSNELLSSSSNSILPVVGEYLTIFIQKFFFGLWTRFLSTQMTIVLIPEWSAEAMFHLLSYIDTKPRTHYGSTSFYATFRYIFFKIQNMAQSL